MSEAEPRPYILAVCGFSSNVGKTTLVRELLKRLPGWEAIKLTRGHYRSCGKDPLGCCVSDLLSTEAIIRSGRESNYESGKDTGHFWDAGASNVHWVIATDSQVEHGINQALNRVKSAGVIVEGNSFLNFIDADLCLMCSRDEGGIIKSTARQTLKKADFIYLSTLELDDCFSRMRFAEFLKHQSIPLNVQDVPVLTQINLPEVIALATEGARQRDRLSVSTYR